MSRLRERERKEREEFKREVEETITIEDLKSSHTGKLFELLLDRDGNRGLAERIVKKEDTKDDREEMRRYRKELQEMIDEAKEAGNMLSGDMIADLGRLHPEFGEIVKSARNVSEISSAIVSQLEVLRITDEGRFRNILDKLKNVERRQKMENEVEGEIRDLSEEYGISHDKVSDSLDIDVTFDDMLENEIDPDEVRRVLKNLGISEKKEKEFEGIMDRRFRGDRGVELRRLAIGIRDEAIRKMLGEVRESSWYERIPVVGRFARRGAATEIERKKENLVRKRGDIEAAIMSTKTELQSLGSFLFSSLNENDDLEKAIADIGGKKGSVLEQQTSVKEANKMMPDSKDIAKGWQQYIKEHKLAGKRFDALSDDDPVDTAGNPVVDAEGNPVLGKNSHRDAFIKEFKEQRVGKKKGLLAQIGEAITEAYLQSQRNELK